MKDKRYGTLKHILESGQIREFVEIFDILPKSVLVKDCGFSGVRFNDKLRDPRKFSIKDILKMAAQIDTEPVRLFELIYQEADKLDKKKPPSSLDGGTH